MTADFIIQRLSATTHALLFIGGSCAPSLISLPPCLVHSKVPWPRAPTSVALQDWKSLLGVDGSEQVPVAIAVVEGAAGLFLAHLAWDAVDVEWIPDSVGEPGGPLH